MNWGAAETLKVYCPQYAPQAPWEIVSPATPKASKSTASLHAEDEVHS